MLANVNLQKYFGALAMRGRIAVIGNRGSVDFNPRLAMNKNAPHRRGAVSLSRPSCRHPCRAGSGASATVPAAGSSSRSCRSARPRVPRSGHGERPPRQDRAGPVGPPRAPGHRAALDRTPCSAQDWAGRSTACSRRTGRHGENPTAERLMRSDRRSSVRRIDLCDRNWRGGGPGHRHPRRYSGPHLRPPGLHVNAYNAYQSIIRGGHIFLTLRPIRNAICWNSSPRIVYILLLVSQTADREESRAYPFTIHYGGLLESDTKQNIRFHAHFYYMPSCRYPVQRTSTSRSYRPLL